MNGIRWKLTQNINITNHWRAISMRSYSSYFLEGGGAPCNIYMQLTFINIYTKLHAAVNPLKWRYVDHNFISKISDANNTTSGCCLNQYFSSRLLQLGRVPRRSCKTPLMWVFYILPGSYPTVSKHWRNKISPDYLAYVRNSVVKSLWCMIC